MADIFNMLDTWNASGTTFTGIKLNVTDTASAAGSLLMDLQVGGVSRFTVQKDGDSTFSDGTGRYLKVLPSDGISQTNLEVASFMTFNSGASGIWGFGSEGIRLGSSRFLSFGSHTSVGDTILARDAANTLAQRNGVNAQAFNLYNTYTDASNYERGFMRWSSNVLQIGSDKLGTGTARALVLQTDGVARLTIGTDGVITNSSSSPFFNLYVGGDVQWNGQGSLTFTADGLATIRGWGSSFGRLRFGGTTSSFPAIKRDTTSLQVRLADDSAFTNIQGKLTTDTAYTAGAPTATGYIVLFDSTGTAYRVPAVAN